MKFAWSCPGLNPVYPKTLHNIVLSLWSATQATCSIFPGTTPLLNSHSLHKEEYTFLPVRYWSRKIWACTSRLFVVYRLVYNLTTLTARVFTFLYTGYVIKLHNGWVVTIFICPWWVGFIVWVVTIVHDELGLTLVFTTLQKHQFVKPNLYIMLLCAQAPVHRHRFWVKTS